VNYFNPIPQFNPILILALLVWSMFWKILALWRAAKNNQRYWFIGVLLLNTFGIIELVYLFKFAKNKLSLEDLKKSNFFPN